MMQTYRYGGALITVSVGDLTEQTADVIVNAANNIGWMGGGVASALKRRGGGEIESDAVDQGPVRLGDAKVTTAGRLKAGHVVHAAVMGMDHKTDSRVIAQATRSALEAAVRLAAGSIAFPAFGTGVGRFPPREAAAAMTSALRDFLDRRSVVLKDIRFVLFNEEIYNEFIKATAAAFKEAE